MRIACGQCNNQFLIASEDFQFLEKISPLVAGKKYMVPPPTLCPQCRQRRRMSFRNERNLYRRTCDITGKQVISVFSPESPNKVADKNYWFSEAFDPFAYGRPYDFNRPFFEQFKEFLLDIPFPSLRIENSENCEFNNDLSESSNCYLCSRTHLSQNMLYTYRGNRSNDCVDCTQVTKCSHLYDCVECQNCHDSRYLLFCADCASSAFLLDCRGCVDCFMCSNLRNKRYCFLNEQFNKKDYFDKLEQFNLASRLSVAKARQMFHELCHSTMRRNLCISSCENVSGDHISHSKNCYLCFNIQGCESGRYLWDVKQYYDSMDAYSGGRGSELIYEATSATASYDVQFCARTFHCQHSRYSLFLTFSSNIFGSFGLSHEEYCILNQKYSAEEYKTLLPKIIGHMQQTKEWGEFFPPQLSPFAYNETAAYENFPLSEKEALSLGYRWLDLTPRINIRQSYQVPDSIEMVRDDIVKQSLSCAECSKNYLIVPLELLFYRNQRIPIPDICVECRYLKRRQTKNPQKLRMDKCARCRKPMETTFAQDADMLIYCQECYQKEVG